MKHAPHRAFTLVELLLVLTIIGVLTAIALPRFSVAMSGGRLRVALRTLAQAGRYGRTMAILHQFPVDLVLDMEGESVRLRVEARASSARRDEREAGSFDDMDDGSAPESAEAFDGGDALRVSHALSGIVLHFLGYGDAPPGEPDGAAETGTVRIRYAPNGTCRPHAFRVTDPGGVAYELHVDRVGTPEVVEPRR